MSVVSEERIREVAARAAEIIRTNGWYQGFYVDNLREDRKDVRECPVCLAGAINIADGRDPRDEGLFGDSIGAFAAIRRRIERLTNACLIAEWNDDPSRTADEVIAVLEQVAAGEGAP